jgi:hypothetical protein
LLAQNLDLFGGDARAVRLGFQPFAETAYVRVQFEPDDARVAVCPLQGVDDAIVHARCRNDIGSGVREPITSDGLKAVAIVLTGSGRVRADVRVEFDEAGREVSIRVPALPAPPGAAVCRDNGCNPFFEVRPVRGGAFSARATWSGGGATFVLLSGTVLGRSQTSTGVPYAEAVRRDGRSPLQISTRLSAPAEYALVLRQTTGALTDIAIDSRWP